MSSGKISIASFNLSKLYGSLTSHKADRDRTGADRLLRTGTKPSPRLQRHKICGIFIALEVLPTSLQRSGWNPPYKWWRDPQDIWKRSIGATDSWKHAIAVFRKLVEGSVFKGKIPDNRDCYYLLIGCPDSLIVIPTAPFILPTLHSRTFKISEVHLVPDFTTVHTEKRRNSAIVLNGIYTTTA